MVEQFNNNFIVDPVDLTTQEKYKLILEKEMLYNELEFNPQYDEYITFNHYYSVYQNFDCEIEKVDHFPFLVQCEFLNSSFLRGKPIQDPLKATPASIIGRVKQFPNSRDDSFKKDFLENIKVYSEIIGIETTSFLLIPTLAKIVDDTIVIKNKFLSVLPTFIDYLYTKETVGYEIIRTSLLNIIEELYHPDSYMLNDQETKGFLFESFVKVGKLISNDDKEMIMKIILGFANQETQEPLKTEQKYLCMRSIDKLADVLGREVCDNYFIPQLYSFSFESDFQIRIEVLITLPSVAQASSFNLITTKIYEMLQSMAKDSIYKVRKACVETLPKIIKINKERSLKTHLNSKNSLFIDLIDVLIYDNNKEVRLTVLERIGEIIHQLTREELSIKLFDFYKNSIEEYYFNIRDSEMEGRYNSAVGMEKMVYYFAYNFPAVLYCYGAEYWIQLKKIYKNLCEERDKTIKKSIISSFHEIASIIGKDRTEQDLLPIYDKYLQSTDKNEKNLAMRNLPKILQVVSKEIKETYFKYFEAISLFKDNDNNLRKFNFVNWKNKLDVVESILCYYNLYDYEIIYKQIIPPCLSFCLDEVYLVRKTSSRVLANILAYLYISNYQKDKTIGMIHSFAFNRNIQMRVIFIKMCIVFFNYYLLYKEVICDILYMLLKDKLIDVKISLAKLLSKVVTNDKAFLYKDKEIHRMCVILITNEKSQTIQSYLKDKVVIDADDKLFVEKENSKGIEQSMQLKFDRNMNPLIIEFKLQIPLENEDGNNNKEDRKVNGNKKEDDNDSYGEDDEAEEEIVIKKDNQEINDNNNGEELKEMISINNDDNIMEMKEVKDDEIAKEDIDNYIENEVNNQLSNDKVNDIQEEKKEEVIIEKGEENEIKDVNIQNNKEEEYNKEEIEINKQIKIETILDNKEDNTLKIDNNKDETVIESHDENNKELDLPKREEEINKDQIEEKYKESINKESEKENKESIINDDINVDQLSEVIDSQIKNREEKEEIIIEHKINENNLNQIEKPEINQLNEIINTEEVKKSDCNTEILNEIPIKNPNPIEEQKDNQEELIIETTITTLTDNKTTQEYISIIKEETQIEENFSHELNNKDNENEQNNAKDNDKPKTEKKKRKRKKKN